MLYLTIGIDTESDNQWSTDARLHPTYENIYALPRLTISFRKCGARPTYLVTYPVATETRSAEHDSRARGFARLRDRRASSRVGNATVRSGRSARPAVRTADSDRSIRTSARESDAGDRRRRWIPRPCRTDPDAMDLTQRTRRCSKGRGILWIRACTRCSTKRIKGGPDFVDAPLTPYFLAYDSATRPGGSSLLEVPISAGSNRSLPAGLVRAYGRAPSPYHTKRVLRLARIVKTCWLRPSYSSLDDMKHLARRMVDAARRS